MTGEIDVYTRQPIESRSREHILLNGLGGTETSIHIMDVSTNSRFGESIDAKLLKMIDPFRVILAAKSGDGAAPPKLKGIEGADGEKYNVMPGGKPERGKPVFTKKAESDGTISFAIEARSQEEAEHMLQQVLAKLQPTEIRRSSRTAGQSAVPRLQFSCQINPNVLRCIAKMTCNLLADNNKDMFLHEAFDDVRTFVATCDGSWSDFVVLSPEPIYLSEKATRIGEVDHLILLKGNAETGEVTATVAIFGFLQFIVRLGKTDLGSHIAYSYRVDQIGRSRRLDHHEDLALAYTSFEQADNLHETSGVKAFSQGVEKLLAVAEAAQMDRWLDELLHKCMDEVFADKPEGELVTGEEIGRLSDLIAEQYVFGLANTGRLKLGDQTFSE